MDMLIHSREDNAVTLEWRVPMSLTLNFTFSKVETEMFFKWANTGIIL